MNSELRRRLKKVLTPPTVPLIRVADGGTFPVLGMCSARISVADRSTSVLLAVLEKCSHDLILGMDFLSAHSALIDCGTGLLQLDLPCYHDAPPTRQPRLCSVDYVRLPPQAVIYVNLRSSSPIPDGDYILTPIVDVLFAKNVALPHTLIRVTDSRTSLPILNFSWCTQLIPGGMTLAHISSIDECAVSAFITDASLSSAPSSSSHNLVDGDIDKMIASDLLPAQTADMRRILMSYRDIFDFNDRPLGQTSVVTHRINTGDASPIRRRPYRVSHAEREVIQREVDKMFTKDVIEPSCSPWASPVVLVKKKDGSWRFCVDYRHLNKVTRKDVYPLPRIDDALDCLHGSAYFSSIDLRSGYWQISVDDQDREKTAFVTPDGLYQFKVMPFGLCNAPATFERMMDSLLRGYKWSTCLCYLDDVIVFSPTFDSHLSRLSAVLEVFRRAGLQLNSAKCRFGRREITVLGHLVSAEGVQPDPEKFALSKTSLCHVPLKTYGALSGCAPIFDVL